MVDDWIAHTPKAILAQNFGVNVSVFDTVPTADPYILNATVSTANDTGPSSGLTGNSSYGMLKFSLSPLLGDREAVIDNIL